MARANPLERTKTTQTTQTVRSALASLAADLDRIARAAHHERLDIGENADSTEIRRAFLALVKRYHPHRYSHLGRECEKLANEIFLLVKDAHDFLADRAAQREKGAQPRRKRRTSAPPAARTGRQQTVRFRDGAGDTAPKVAPARPPVPEGAEKTGPIRPLVTPVRGPAAPDVRKPARKPARAKAAREQVAARRGRARRPRRAMAGGNQAKQAAPEELAPAAATAPADHTGLVAKLASEEESKLAAFRAASKLLRSGRASDARNAFRELAVANPSDKRYRTYMHFAWGREHEFAGRDDKAATEYQRALNVSPMFTPALEALEELEEKQARPGMLGRLFKGRQK